MTIESLEFSYRPDGTEIVGTLVYRAPTCLPGLKLQVNFLDDLAIDEVIVTDWPHT